jgi:hypothetical protein
MTSVEFEQMLSFKPDKVSPCLRDLIFDHYLELSAGDGRLADRCTKAYTDLLHAKMKVD